MKNVLLALTALIALMMPARTAAQPHSVGIEVASVASSSGGASVDSSILERAAVLRPAIGIHASTALAAWHGFELDATAGLSLSPRGYDVYLNGVSQGGFRSRYIELPIGLRIASPAMGLLRLTASAGVVPAYLVAARSRSYMSDYYDTRHGTRRFDVGLSVGAGALVEVMHGVQVGAEARYVHGTMTIDRSGSIEVEHRAFVLAVSASMVIGDRSCSCPDSHDHR